jgi:tRNA A37 threonylcarbamoyladenosine dehydratase
MARQIAAITELGQARMGAATIALIGAGGAGSMVADQVAHMGIGRVFICEADIVKHVNLSRQCAAGPSNLGASKAVVTAAGMRHANPEVTIVIIPERFPDLRSHVLLRDVDLIVSCVDSAMTRHEINKFSRRFLIPVIDVGATIRRKDDRLEQIAGPHRPDPPRWRVSRVRGVDDARPSGAGARWPQRPLLGGRRRHRGAADHVGQRGARLAGGH